MVTDNNDIILRLNPVRREKLKRYLDSVVHGLPMEDVADDESQPADDAPRDKDAPAPR